MTRRQYIALPGARSLLFVASCAYGAVVVIFIAQAYADVPCFELLNVYGCMLLSVGVVVGMMGVLARLDRWAPTRSK